MSTIERIRELYAKRREIDEEIEKLKEQHNEEIYQEDIKIKLTEIKRK